MYNHMGGIIGRQHMQPPYTHLSSSTSSTFHSCFNTPTTSTSKVDRSPFFLSLSLCVMDDTTQWPVQGMVVVKAAERKARPAHKEDGLNCPRCSSTNTKFCYYNNYSLTQPRYLCKACRRYWTQGGCLRNVPVGGGSRKYRRPSSRSTTTSSTNQNPKIQYSSHYNNNNNNNSSSSIEMSEYMGLPFDSRNPNYFTNSSLPVMELFKTAGNMGIYDSSGFHDYKTSLGFPAEGYNGNDNNLSRNINSPIGDTKQLQVSNVDHRFDHEIQAEPNNGGFWNGMIAGGSSW